MDNIVRLKQYNELHNRLMFLPERITKIHTSDRVLEVGPGGNPHPRSDVLLERRFDNIEEALIQRGYGPEINTDKPIHYYDGGRFPFADKEFDYVICSHVIEHVPATEMRNFLNELSRVALRGYIEFPSGLYELVNQQDVHRWYMTYDGNSIVALAKDRFSYPPVAFVLRAIFYANGDMFSPVFSAYRDIFFYGFEWEGNISIKEVETWQDLYPDSEMNSLSQKLAMNGRCIQPSANKKTADVLIKKFMRRSISLVRRLWVGFTGKVYSSRPKIDRTAILNNRSLIELEEGVEIKAGVIINTHHNAVTIGSHSQINPYTVIYGGSGVKIGRNVMIAPHCMIAAGNHDYRQLEVPMRFAGTLTKGPIVIEDDVWIGANCTIADGVRIGAGAVVGANTLVNRDVAPYDIVVGVPAQPIANRRSIN